MTKDSYCPAITVVCHNYERTRCSSALSVPIWCINTRELQKKIYIPTGATNPIYNTYYGPDASVHSPHNPGVYNLTLLKNKAQGGDILTYVRTMR